jgi:hypothetical protein
LCTATEGADRRPCEGWIGREEGEVFQLSEKKGLLRGGSVREDESEEL